MTMSSINKLLMAFKKKVNSRKSTGSTQGSLGIHPEEFLITTRDHYQQFASAEHRKFVAARARFLRWPSSGPADGLFTKGLSAVKVGFLMGFLK
jgi:hypothetical protein